MNSGHPVHVVVAQHVKFKRTSTSTYRYCCSLTIFLQPLLLALIISASYIETHAQDLTDTPNNLRLLEVPGFKVEARLRIVRENSVQIDGDLKLTEHYSNELNRARLDIHSIKRALGSSITEANGLTYYFNKQDETKLFIRADASPVYQAKECKLTNEEVFAHDLFGAAAYADGHLTSKIWLKSRSDVPDHIVGLSRLMLIVNANRDKLVETGNESVIRNHRTRQFKFNDTFGSIDNDEKPSFFTVYYPKIADHVEQLEYPLRIWFISSTRAELIIDFYFIDYTSSSIVNQEEGLVDIFSYPLGLECSLLMPPVSMLNGEVAPKLVSFRAEIESKNDDANIRNYFIAHDDYAEALRIDTMKTLLGKFQSEYSTTILDLKKNRRYNIRQLLHPVKSTFLGSSDRQCIMTLIDESRSDTNLPSIGSLIPVYQLVSLGRAYVRGVKTEAFEYLTMELPVLLFPSLRARNQGERSFYHVKDDSDHDPQSTYSITYYFSTLITDEPNTPSLWIRGMPLGPLMQIDIRLKRRLIYKINVFDFVWTLADAPNGDSRSELFTLTDLCQESDSSALSTERYADLSMDLEFREIDQLAYITAPDALQFFHGPSMWKQELTRALVESSKLSAPNIYDMEAKIRPVSREKMLIQVEGNLVDARPVSFEAVKIGDGVIHNSRNPTTANNFDECFLDAAHRAASNQGSHSLFSYCLGVCLIDSNVIITQRENGSLEVKKSEVFTKPIGGGQPPCLLFLPLKSSSSVYGKSSSRSLWSSTYTSLRGKMLSLPLADIRSKPVKMLNFHIRRFEIDNNRWLGDANGLISNVRPDSDSHELIGLGLPIATSKKVEPRKLTVDNLDLETSSAMNYEQCHSSCLTDIRCRSFSLCTRESNFELECLSSELEFRDSSILDQIEKESSQLKISGKKGMITVNFETNDEDQTGSAQVKQINLRVDRRCRIYNKNTLETFRRLRKETVKLSSWMNRTLIPVEDEEECADRCLQRNVGFFKKASKDKLELLRTKQYLTETAYLTKMLALQKSNMDTWCASFSYLNLESLSEEVLAGLDERKLSKSGLCTLSRHKLIEGIDKNQDGKNDDTNEEDDVTLHRYAFIYNSMFMKNPGFRLKPKWTKFFDSGKENQWSFEEIETFFKNHNKQHVKEVSRPEECARSCFRQSINLNFLCKSFGIFHENLVNMVEKGKPKAKTYCIFNSITLAEARKSSSASDLFDEVPSTLGYVHYEPLESFTTNDAMIARLLLKDDYSVINELKFSHFGSFTSLVLLLISLACGIVIGMKLGEQIINVNGERRESVTNPSRLFLSSLVGGSSDITHQRFDTEIDLPDLKGS